MRSFLLSLSLLVTLSTALPSTAGAAELQLTQGEVRVPMPGRTVTAGYFSLVNNSAAAVELVKASSPAFARVELHQHIKQDDVMRMVEVEAISVDPGATLVFQPGGLHLMLFEPQVALTVGETVSVTLYFADNTTKELELPLTAMPRR
ncbi:copper chaperone PCu(A)C [Alishewanella sp. d11]|uniref:copper chaperone PCu(A)C n=1 Tax=Alishewanella sp. d11 TaxID=3414030 RepID=UPI003BF8C58B